MNLSFEEFHSFSDAITQSLFPPARDIDYAIGVKQKDDGTIVTSFDIAIEEKIRKVILNSFPDHNIIGEEGDDLNNGSDYTWVIDPIDGTFSFSHGVPLFGTLLGLLFRNIPLYGAMRLPMYGNSFLAGDSKKCLHNGKECTVKSFHGCNESLILTTDLERIRKSRFKHYFDDLIKSGCTVRTWGDCFGYFMLCTGKADLMMDLELKRCDILPLIPIIRGSGAVILKLSCNEYENIIACTPEMVEKIQT